LCCCFFLFLICCCCLNFILLHFLLSIFYFYFINISSQMFKIHLFWYLSSKVLHLSLMLIRFFFCVSFIKCFLFSVSLDLLVQTENPRGEGDERTVIIIFLFSHFVIYLNIALRGQLWTHTLSCVYACMYIYMLCVCMCILWIAIFMLGYDLTYIYIYSIMIIYP